MNAISNYSVTLSEQLRVVSTPYFHYMLETALAHTD